MPMLEVRDLTVRFGTRTVVDNVSFSLEEGRWLMLIGPNGAGKSTIVNAVTQSVGYTGQILWDTSKPNGTPRKLLDVSKATELGWTYHTELREGLELTYRDFLENPMRAER